MPTTNQALILVPLLVLVALTLVGFLAMATARGKVAKSMDPSFYRAQLGTPEPESARTAVRHWDNLFEFPTVVYAACLTAFVLGAVGTWTLVFAWGFVAARLVQSAVHLTYNNPAHRGIAFVIGVVFAMALWVNVGMAVLAAI
jgi:hypothetical protein